jgi:hypothetical protein
MGFVWLHIVELCCYWVNGAIRIWLDAQISTESLFLRSSQIVLIKRHTQKNNSKLSPPNSKSTARLSRFTIKIFLFCNFIAGNAVPILLLNKRFSSQKVKYLLIQNKLQNLKWEVVTSSFVQGCYIKIWFGSIVSVKKKYLEVFKIQKEAWLGSMKKYFGFPSHKYWFCIIILVSSRVFNASLWLSAHLLSGSRGVSMFTFRESTSRLDYRRKWGIYGRIEQLFVLSR